MVERGCEASDFNRSSASRFSAVLRYALSVFLRALWGVHISGVTGECSQTGQLAGRAFWPSEVSFKLMRVDMRLLT